MFPLTSVEHIVTEESDHMALLVRVCDEPPRRPNHRGFIFEEMWLKHEGYEEMVKNYWEARDRGINGINDLWR
jgi:hypothetical protein